MPNDLLGDKYRIVIDCPDCKRTIWAGTVCRSCSPYPVDPDATKTLTPTSDPESAMYQEPPPPKTPKKKGRY